ncbi:hypothetical protein M2451_002784 [Dysgonomonas sp. PFB1-18]|uniref:STAS-like domain-containing protein n=1 Tax=unclassified Dysgonomonas TaxID=2630389 RepID=UPI00247661E8|nr:MULTISPECIES: STAS-like domain-containing protein [unclassified Dysgonomonas]MDH6309330.1 hypothetical protein [Dysgonomonas sp. PF1-14]MDH6339805.1 hypothetical protein [Dysgonomonas sp. PF1-16]MDH6381453.1 hypothetical protein [Dysgonomonas sp. PFB1-18]MDH6398668.1 hypothetical protein [Dysgonomonas sp. PF1-23]
MIVISLYGLLLDSDYRESGKAVLNKAVEAIDENELVVIDMDKVDSVPTIFMNASFGPLIDKYGVDRIKKSLRFRNVLKSQVERISKYFSDYQKIIDLSNI